MRVLHTPLMSVLPEGWVVVAVLVIGAEGFYQHDHLLLALLTLLLALPALAYFRDVNREVPGKARAVLSPVDGVVVHRRECYDPILEREAIRLLVQVDWWGAYCLRAPVEGDVEALPASAMGAVSRLRTDEGDDIVVAVTRGSLLGARPVNLPFGERVGQGRRCGLRRFAREIELLIPAGARVEVSLGQRVRSGQTSLATMLRRS